MKKSRRANYADARKQHRALAFFFTFVFSLIIFGSIAAAFLHFTFPSISEPGKGALNVQADEKSYPISNSFTMIISVRPDFDSEPDELILYRLDAKSKRTVIMPIPLNLEIPVNGEKTSLSTIVKNNSVSEAAKSLSSAISVKIDFTCDIDEQNFLKIFDKLGGLYYSIPQNISLKLTDNSEIKLYKSPRQYLNGAKIYALLAYPSYNGGDYERYQMQSELTKEFIAEKLTEFNLRYNISGFAGIFNYVTTDFSINELIKRTDALIDLSTEKKIETLVPDFKISPYNSSLVQFSDLKTIQKSFG